ncbi:uroporphyrinogen-III C-methyltransferase [Ottowia sp.]|jgi:uroporphyrin-3 C-methyltransferase|uniref:uroporphyrinogen-III C-methyltransferase n=1 Tax=Ottowia sp. TaxID=1898956 RepID=UPI0025EE5E28|nr:uroporphyrinogen-III C-methyltransferase [Ottowia sp.]MBK6613264.1 uroporphyrinogen-III C-methyltransferase [Ottowia sp.]MBK6747629.1 uroporphyrinogen-III C-methyltransferase [Ottowia sp.]
MSVDQPSATPPAAMAPTPLHAAPRAGAGPGLVLAWILAAVALTTSVLLWQKVSGMQEQLARQSADAGSRSVEARTLARQAEAEVRDTVGKVAALEGRVSDLAAYRAQLEDLVQSVARTRDENLAVELEAALRVARDQAQLTGSVEPLLAALRTAERRLARASDPRLAPVARAVARDLERVKTAAIPDTAGLLARIDQLLRQVDDLPVANDVGSADAAPRGAPAQEAPATWWERVGHVFAEEARSLLRVSRVERPEATLLSPDQAFFVRENLKLRLQGARLGLLARQYEAARADLAASAAALGAWFDPTSRRTQAAATLLQQIQGVTRSADLPRVDETLVALGSAVAASQRAPASK